MKFILPVLFTLIMINSFASTNENSSPRQLIPLDFDWKFHKGDITGADTTGMKDSEWETINLPHEWSIFGTMDEENKINWDDFTKWVRWRKNGSQGYLPMGTGWYQKHFTLLSKYKGKQIYISFEGIYRNSDIWLNGTYLKHWDSGYVGFMVDITSSMKWDEENILCVKVDPKKAKEEWWYQGCGIYRHVKLIITDSLHVAPWGTYVTTPNITAEEAQVHITMEIANSSHATQSATLVNTITDEKEKIVGITESKSVFSPGTTNTIIQNRVIISNPVLWSLENPYLYKIKTEIRIGNKTLDEYDTPFGIRTIHFDPEKGFFLNGRHVKIQGSDDHDDFAGLGTAIPNRIHVKHVELLKEAGVNYLRAGGHTFSNELYDAADKLGMLMSQETRYFDDSPWGQEMLRQVIHQYRNHPSIILWGLGNEEEPEGTLTGSSTLSILNQVAHKEDHTRYTYILQAHNYNKAGFSDITDVLGCNYRSWQDLDDDHIKYPRRINFASEFNFTPQDWNEMMKRVWMAGGGIWSGFMYKGELDWPNNSWPGSLYDNSGYPYRLYWDIKKAFTGKEEKSISISHGPATKLVLKADRTRLANDSQDVAVVHALLEDNQGNIVIEPYTDSNYYGASLDRSHTDTKVEFSVEGAGQLVGVSNRDPYTHEQEKTNIRSTYMGVCAAIVQTKLNPGKIFLNAKTEAGLMASLVLESVPGISPYSLPAKVEKQPIQVTPSDWAGFTNKSITLSQETIHSNQFVEVTSQIENKCSIYPVTIVLFVANQEIKRETFAVNIGDTRKITILTPPLFPEGECPVKLEYWVNGEKYYSAKRNIQVLPTPALLQCLDLKAPAFVFANETIQVTAIVQNIGGKSLKNKIVSLWVDGIKIVSKQVNIAAGERQSLLFEYQVPSTKDSIKFRVEDVSFESVVQKPFSIQSSKGILVHGKPMRVKGRVGDALLFNGKDDYLEIPSVDLKDKSFTLSAWVLMRNTDVDVPIFSGGQGKQNLGLHCGIRYGKPFMGFWGDDYYGNQKISLNQWVHLTWVMERQFIPPQTGLQGATASWKNLQKVYLNGKLDGERFCNAYLGDLRYIGTFWGSSFLDGSLDELRVYDWVLSEQEILQLYQGEPAKENLVFWLNFKK